MRGAIGASGARGLSVISPPGAEADAVCALIGCTATLSLGAICWRWRVRSASSASSCDLVRNRGNLPLPSVARR